MRQLLVNPGDWEQVPWPDRRRLHRAVGRGEARIVPGDACPPGIVFLIDPDTAIPTSRRFRTGPEDDTLLTHEILLGLWEDMADDSGVEPGGISYREP